jgi:Subtilase family
VIRRSIAFALLCQAAGSTVFAAGPPKLWDLALARNKSARTTVTALNRCHAQHSFEITKDPALGWFALTGGARVDVPPGGSAPAPARIDTSGLDPGEYEGNISVRCLDCSSEPACTQDVDVVRARLKVLWPEEDLKALDPAEEFPHQVLLVLETGGDLERALRELEKNFGLKAARTSELASIGRAVALLEITARDISPPEMVRRIQSDPRVRQAQPNFLYQAAQARYNDPEADRQYGLHQLHADDVQTLATGAGVRVAVLDSEIDRRQPDLDGAVAETADFYGPHLGAIESHGTEMAGIIGARANNAIGIYGVAPHAALLGIRVCGSDPEYPTEVCSSEAISRGIDFAVAKGARVINMSLAGPYDPLVARLILQAVSRNVVAVAATGNSGPAGPPRYPAAFPEVIAVTAVDQKEQIYSRAVRGPHVTVAASGVGVLTTAVHGRFENVTGTSPAAAQVSGAVALLLELKPSLTPADVKALLEDTARDLGPPGRDDLYGAGLVDLCRAIGRLRGTEDVCR